MNKQTIIGIIIGIVIASLIYSGYSVYIIKQKLTYQQGYNQALNQTSISLYNQFLNSAITCTPLTIFYNETTKLNFYWEGCRKLK